MERKTKINAEDGKQDLVITREFDLPLELLFKAFEEPELIEQWMGTKVLKLENKKHGSWHFVTTDQRTVKFSLRFFRRKSIRVLAQEVIANAKGAEIDKQISDMAEGVFPWRILW